MASKVARLEPIRFFFSKEGEIHTLNNLSGSGSIERSGVGIISALEAIANGSNGQQYADIDDADIDFSEIENKYAVRFDEGLDDVVVIDNVPVVGREREQKLLETIVKRFKSHA